MTTLPATLDVYFQDGQKKYYLSLSVPNPSGNITNYVMNWDAGETVPTKELELLLESTVTDTKEAALSQ